MRTSASTSVVRKRRKVEMLDLDQRIRPLYEQGWGCRKIAAHLGENPSVVYKRVRAMGILRTRNEDYQARQVAPMEPVPFTAMSADRNLRAAAVGEAIAWFLQRGYIPAIPVEPTRYDLVVESDDGLQRVQVKSTNAKERDRWVVGVTRLEYGQLAASASNANGWRSRTVYQPGDIDFFFVVTGDGDKYLIPLTATGGATALTLDKKYAAYKVEDHRTAGTDRIPQRGKS